MGFLDHSTNNVIIDAVLTDYGRRLLAENQGGFKVAFFSLADDEVDYTTIRKFGRMVGKEKIAKNTPIFEAQTSTNLSMKHRLITLPNPLVSVMPTLTLDSSISGGTAPTGTTKTVLFDAAGEVELTFTQVLKHVVGTSTTQSIPSGLSDSTFTILMNDRFFYINGGHQISVEPNTKIAAYSKSQTSSGAGGVTNAAQVKFKVARRPIDSSLYTQYGDQGSSPATISTVLSVIGDQSGLRADIKLQIQPLTA